MALEWIAGEQGLDLVTQHRVQDFCWYELPVKWMTGQDDHARITAFRRAAAASGITPPDLRSSRGAR